MHGKWTAPEDVFIVTLRLGTGFSWRELETEFNRRFPPATAKDLESRYNKTLRPGRNVAPQDRRVSDIIDDYRHYGGLDTESDADFEVIQAALLILDDYPTRRLWY
ncbi:hypothetical protein FQN51_005929 [Onygenales sp. PD_10]|nr:hypothetical protein FQN51_005929 [Onygenales sp. PD_10]